MAIYKATPGDSSLVKGAKNTSTLLVAKATQVKTQKVSVAQNLSNLLIAKAVGSALSKVNHLAYITLTQGLHYYSDFLSSTTTGCTLPRESQPTPLCPSLVKLSTAARGLTFIAVTWQ